MSSTEVVAGEPPAADASASSSTAEGDKGSVLDAVKASLQPTEGSPASSDTGNETTKAEPVKGEAADGEPAEDPLTLTEAEKKVLSPRAQERFRNLVTQRNEADAKATALAPKAESYDRIVGFNRQHGISDSEFNNTLELLRLSKTDKPRAFEIVSGILQNLAQSTGRAISPELQERIRLGHISEQDARRLSQVEAEAKLTKENAEAQSERAEFDRRERAWNEQVSTSTAAVDEWAKAQAASDPDWPKKVPLMAEALEAELQRGGPAKYPKNKAEAVALAERIKTKVETNLKPFKQQKPAIAPPNGEGSSSRNQVEPKSAVEAAVQALAKMSG